MIFNELVEGMDARGMNHANDLGWMIDASHNVKDPLEDLLQSVEAILLAYAQALLVDRKKLNEAQEANDVAAAQEILQDSFRTDTRAIVAEARIRSGGALNPAILQGTKDSGKIDQRKRSQNCCNGFVMQRTAAIAIFDIGKTNKKLLLFNEQYQVLHEESRQFGEIQDEDGFACEDVERLSEWIKEKVNALLNNEQYTIKAINFSAYGASFVC